MNTNEFLVLVCKKLSGEADRNDLDALEDLFSSNADFKRQFKLLSQYWEQQDTPKQLVVDDALQKVLQRLQLPALPANALEMNLQKKKSLSTKLLRMSIAAAMLALVSISTVMLLQKNKKDVQQDLSRLEKKQNTKGTKSTIELADGSKVWLNADSKIQYPSMFAGKLREVYLNGEAFFEVAKNPAKPFIIHLANGTVRVLGTSFNIRAYDNEKIVETSVATGKVAFIPKYNSDKKQDTVFVTPNNKIRYQYNAEEVTVMPTLAKDDKAWTEGKLIFKAMRLEDIAVQLERNFGKKVNFIDSNAKRFILTGAFQNNTLEEVMFYLSKTKNFYYKFTNNELLIATSPAGLY